MMDASASACEAILICLGRTNASEESQVLYGAKSNNVTTC
jgi:hypothetical protein